MTDILDDWFGFDPAPAPPAAEVPAVAAPVRTDAATQTVTTGVDATRELTGQTSSSRTGRSSQLFDTTTLGVGLNV